MGEEERVKVSVLITFFNQEKYVDRALQSVFEQKTNFKYEILIGDDGSSDHTVDIVEKWKNQYPDIISLFVMERKQYKYIGGFRASQNRLNLLKYVKGEFFAFLDGDDYFDYEFKLQRQVDIMERAENTDCITCGHNVDMLFDNGARKPITYKGLGEGKIIGSTYWDNYYIHTDSLLTRSSVIPGIDTFMLENSFNDNLITFSFIQQGKIYYIPESWSIYVQTGDGIWTEGNKIINSFREMLAYDTCNNINQSMKKQTSHRFGRTWIKMLGIRHKIKTEELSLFEKEAQDKKLRYSCKWLHYKDLSMKDRAGLCLYSIYIWITSFKFSGFLRKHFTFSRDI